jgi:hypothetical protein
VGATGVAELEAAEAVEVPLAFVAVTVKVYAVPFVSPETVIGLAPVPVSEPGDEVAVNVVMVLPPVAPAVYPTVAEPLPAVAVPIVGAPGTVVAVMLFEAEEAAEVPIALVAVTVNVYEVDDVKPVTVNGEDAPAAVSPPGLDVTVYEVIAELPLYAGAVKVTDAAPLLKARAVPTSVAVPIVGASGRAFPIELINPLIIPVIMLNHFLRCTK